MSVAFFFAAALFGAGFTADFSVASEAFPGTTAELRLLLVRMPQIDSKAFLPAVPGLGRSQTM